MTTITTTISPNLRYHPALSRMKFDARRPPDPIRVVVDVGMNGLSIVATGPTGQLMRRHIDIPYCFQGAAGGEAPVSESAGSEGQHTIEGADLPPRREARLVVQGPSKAVFTQFAGYGRVDVEVHAFDAIKGDPDVDTPLSTTPVAAPPGACSSADIP